MRCSHACADPDPFTLALSPWPYHPIALSLALALFAQISLQLHLRDPTSQGFDVSSVVAELQEQFSPYPMVDGTHFEANFGHLMGYSAIYYTYMWSQALAQMLLQPFKEHGFYDAATAVQYRDHVLRPGGKAPADSLVYRFLQQPPSLDALHVWLRAGGGGSA